MTVVLAFDIATRTGIALGRAGETPRAVTVNLGVGRSDGARYSRLLRLTVDMLGRFKPGVICYEQPSAGDYGSPFLIGLAACFVGQAHLMGFQPIQIAAPSVRKHFLGRHYTSKDFPDLTRPKAKAAIKQLVITACKARGWPAEDDNQADALAMWDYACAVHCRAPSTPPGGLF